MQRRPEMLQRADRVHKVSKGIAQGGQVNFAVCAQAEPSLLHGPQEATTHVQVAGCAQQPQ